MTKHLLLTAVVGLSICSSGADAQTTFTLTPAPITQCNDRGQGTAQLSWRTAESAVQVRIGSASGAAMTGFEPGNGGVPTGDWVTDGLVFVLVNSSGNEIARAVAAVACQAPSSNLNDQLATQSYFPLEVGNRWIYRYSDRFLTANHRVRWIERTQQEAGETWFVLRDQVAPGTPASESLWRTDSAGRIYRRRNNRSELFLDPNLNPDPGSLGQVQQRNLTLNTIFGRLSNALNYIVRDVGGTETGTLVRGLGPLSIGETVAGGSSGGFFRAIELVEAVIAGKVRFSAPANGLELSPESQTQDLVGRKARNCALPCYFAACGLAGGAPDPPGTYKPCMFTRLKVENAAARSLSLELLNSANDAVYSVTRPLAANPHQQLWFETIPLYRAPSVVLPPGPYQLKATLKSEQGETINSSTASVKIE